MLSLASLPGVHLMGVRIFIDVDIDVKVKEII